MLWRETAGNSEGFQTESCVSIISVPQNHPNPSSSVLMEVFSIVLWVFTVHTVPNCSLNLSVFCPPVIILSCSMSISLGRWNTVPHYFQQTKAVRWRVWNSAAALIWHFRWLCGVDTKEVENWAIFQTFLSNGEKKKVERSKLRLWVQHLHYISAVEWKGDSTQVLKHQLCPF